MKWHRFHRILIAVVIVVLGVFPLASCLKLEDFHGWETGGTDNEEFSFSNAIKSQR